MQVTSGTVYYFQSVVDSGDFWAITAGEYNYRGGSVFVNGTPASGSDYWFREGIIIPEPAGISLILFGVGIFAWGKRKWHES